MSLFQAEPPYRHGTPSRTAILLVNLGTPEAPTAAALRPYLKQFLSDQRVVELPRWKWWPILNGIILNVRPKKSAAKYASVWTPAGSPLKQHTEQQAALLQQHFTAAGEEVTVTWAMRYGAPSIPTVLDRLKAENHTRILVVPLYPQYAGSTSATVVDEVAHWLTRTRNQPEMRFIRAFADDPGYIAALTDSVRSYWAEHGRPEKLLLSFHGVPKATLDQGDPYFCECHKTGRLLAEALELEPEQWQLTFQSRFGRAEWLQPYTAPTLAALGQAGCRRVDVLCPGFVGDCLETLEEIALEGKADFLAAGGGEYHYLPCLNERPEWINALGDLTRRHLSGWPLTVEPPETREASRHRALAAGAPDVK
jgi:ferrochelatase